ncbi:MAG TPA: AAA family ATPase [Candidatus Dormibacteraeota bacterium]|nr:AAA family ATPase [Candidatus Dormibacteraeota bacterium]
MSTSRILVVQGSDKARQKLGAMLSGLGYEVESSASAVFATSLTADNLPDLVVLDDKVGDTSGAEIVGNLRAMPLGKQLPVLLTVGERSRMDQLRIALEVGANDAVDRRARDIEIANRVRRLLSARDADGAPARTANTVTIVSARGGSGKTVLACNLAVAIARYSGETVALLDLNLEFGTTHTLLGLQPRDTLSQIAHAAAEDTSDEDFDAMLLHHASGVRLLPALAQPGDSEKLNDATVLALLNRLRRTYDHLIIDGRPSYREFMIDLWDASDTLVVPCPADVPSVAVTNALLSAFERVGVISDKVVVVVNNIIPRPGLTPGEIQKFLDQPVVTIPHGGDAMQLSVNKGRPYILDHSSDPTGLAIRNLADQLLSLHVGGTGSA